MSGVALYLILVRATLASFSGLGSLPQLREDLVVDRQSLSDDELNRAVLVARTTPGPMGVYVVSVGYEVAGTRGVIAGWLALVTPALLVVPLVRVASRFMRHPRVRGAIAGVVLASAVLIVTAGIPLTLDIIARWRAVLDL